MTKQQEKITVPLKIQGRSYTGAGSIREIVLYILECALKDSGKN